MTLYLFIAIGLAVGVFLRVRYGQDVLPYVTAGLLLVLFLYCPTRFHGGLGQWAGFDAASAEGRLDQLGEIVSFGFLIIAAWIFTQAREKRSD